jgi:16S rRNA (guanine966-N2)-methyltransferase
VLVFSKTYNIRKVSFEICWPTKEIRVRIISGTARGKRLAILTGADIRPTPDKVRGAIFNMLYSRIGSFDGKKILDLCSGTGAMAIEALSRGADHAWLVDNGVQAAKIVPANLTACHVEGRATFIRSDVRQVLRHLEPYGPFDVIFMDPPYGKTLVPALLSGISEGKFLCDDGIVCAETADTDEVPPQVGDLVRVLSRNYGITTVHIFIHPEPEV